MTHTSTEQPEPRYADVVHHANVSPSVSYVARKTGIGYQEAARLLELALQRGDLASGDYQGRRLDLYVTGRENALKQEVEQLRARVQELEASQAQCVPLSDEYIRDIYAEESHWDMVAPYVIAFARSIEAAHGITQEKQG